MLPIQRSAVARRASAALTLVLVLGLSACGTLRDAATGMSTLGGLIKPYKIDVVQGNVITKEQVSALSTGMTRVEVRDVLGTLAGLAPLDAHWRQLVQFSAQYYQRSLGEVALSALPRYLKLA